jgi:DNA-directed RNA polymerase subunit RPC12/RpoP
MVDPHLSKSFIDDDPLHDWLGHGTMIAGIIGARSNNVSQNFHGGIAGTNQSVSLVSLKVTHNGSQNYTLETIQALDYATSKRIPIVNYSSGYRSVDENEDQALEQAIMNYPGLFVTSAGNGAVRDYNGIIDNTGVPENIDIDKFYPASFTSENIITVGGTNPADELMIKDNELYNTHLYASNYGPNSVDVFAPGEDILSTFPIYRCLQPVGLNDPLGCAGDSSIHVDDGYHMASGTSLAAPYVAGVAALLLSRYPDMDTTQLKEAIMMNARKVESLKDKCVSGGILDAYHTLANAAVLSVDGDFNGDGLDDVAKFINSGNNTTSIQLWTSNGNSFDYMGEVWSETNYSSRNYLSSHLVSGDFNGDGLSDIAALFDSNTGGPVRNISVWVSTGTGFTETLVPIDNGTWPATMRIVSGDFNGDGLSDIAALYDRGGGNSSMNVWRSSGDMFTHRAHLLSSISLFQYNSASVANRISSGDFDGDGRDDIITLYDKGQGDVEVHIFRYSLLATSLSRGVFDILSGYEANAVNGRVMMGKYNHDQFSDLLMIRNDGNKSIDFEMRISSGFSFTTQSWWSSNSFEITKHLCETHHTYVGGFCSQCGYEHEHHIVNGYGYCSICGYQILERLLPSDYMYNEQYYFTEEEQGVYSQNGALIMTNRLRCGYISNQYLTLSAKRRNAGIAYLEYHFDHNLQGLMYQLALWSNNESLIQNSSIRLEAMKENEWTIIQTFNPHEMSTDKDNLLDYNISFPFATRSFRFIVETNQVQNENNRGRVVIGEIGAIYAKGAYYSLEP